MKDSGVEWIGSIPIFWETERARRVFTQRNEKGNTNQVLLAATQANGMIPQENLEGVVRVKVDTDLQLFKTVHKGDYVISLRSFQGGFEHSDFEGVCSPAYQVFYPIIKTDSLYFKLLFKCDAFISKINSLTVGIREGKNVLYNDFSNMVIPLPSYREQVQISQVLSIRCAKIDRLISLQEEMIAELQAYKQSVITEAVTKGLDPDVPMKDSGVEWIGKTPRDWMIVKVKHVLVREKDSIRVGPFGSQIKGEDFKAEGYKVYNQRTVLDNDFISGDVFIDEEKYKALISFRLNPDDIIITTRGTIGKIAVAPPNIKEGIIHPCLIKFSIDRNKINDVFLKYIFNDTRITLTQLTVASNATTISVVYSESLKETAIPLPPLEDQIIILRYLDTISNKINHLIDLKQSKIDTLKEYKKSLIYECVTGKREIV